MYVIPSNGRASYKGPTSIAVAAESGTVLSVRFIAPTGNPDGAVYKASSGDHTCEVSENASPLSCLLTGLTNGKEYTIEAVACLGDAKCSDPISAVVYTLSDGM